MPVRLAGEVGQMGGWANGWAKGWVSKKLGGQVGGQAGGSLVQCMMRIKLAIDKHRHFFYFLSISIQTVHDHGLLMCFIALI